MTQAQQVTEAAERLRRNAELVRTEMCYIDEYRGSGSLMGADSAILAREYLRLTDPTSIDEAWADTLSKRQRSGDLPCWVLGASIAGAPILLMYDFFAIQGEKWQVCAGERRLIYATTRGDLIRLCVALGIPLQEPTK